MLKCFYLTPSRQLVTYKSCGLQDGHPRAVHDLTAYKNVNMCTDEHANLEMSVIIHATGSILIKHLMTGPKGNSEFCFPEILNVSRGKAEGNIEVEGKQSSLFPEGPVMKCFVIPPNAKIKKMRKYDLYERQSRRAVLPKLHHKSSRFLRS